MAFTQNTNDMGKRLLTENQIAKVEELADSFVAEAHKGRSNALQCALCIRHQSVWDQIYDIANINGMAEGNDSLIPKFYQILRGWAEE